MRRVLLALLALVSLASAVAAKQVEGVHPYEYGPFYFKNFYKVTGGYTPPTITSGLAIVFGDSRVSNAGGITYTGSTGVTFGSSASFANAWAGEVPALANNALQFSETYNYGVGAQSSAGIAARTNAAGFYCDNTTNSASSGPCWTAVKTTTSGVTTTATLNTAAAGTTGVAAGWYVYFSNASYGVPQLTVSSVNSSTQVTLSQAVSASVPNGATVIFVPPANANAFWSYLGGSTTGFTITDMTGNQGNNSVYSVCSDPAKLVFFMTGTNDSAMPFTQTQPQPLTNQAAIFDALGPSGCNKVVIAGNEVPRGLATALLETHTAAASVVVTNSGTFYDDQGVTYAPLAVTNALGANDGVALTKVAYPCGSVTTGQYCVNAGTYYFGGADVSGSARVAIQYRWGASAGAQYLETIHEWLNSSSCGSFTDTAYSQTYNISGAKCNRPWLTVVDTWGAVLDTGVSTPTNPLPKAFFSIDGLHPITAFGTAMAKKFSTAAATYVGTTPIVASPTLNNFNFTGTTSSATTTATSTCSGLGISNNTNNYYLTSLTPAVSTGYYGAAGYYAGGALFVYMNNSTTTGIPEGTTVDCIDTTNNKLHLLAPATATLAPASNVARLDPAGLAINGMFNHAILTTTAVTNCNTHCGTPSLGTTITQGYPAPWVLALAAGNNTDLTAGTLIFNYGMETNPFSNGYDAFTMQVGGVATTAGLSAVTTMGTPNATVSAGLITPGDVHRAVCTVSISAGANGHLWGVYAPQISLQDTSTVAFTPPNASLSNYTIWNGQVGSGGTGIELTDQDLALNGTAGVLTETLVSPPVRTSLMTAPSSVIKLTWGSDTGVPVSGTLRIQRCSIVKVTS